MCPGPWSVSVLSSLIGGNAVTGQVKQAVGDMTCDEYRVTQD